MNKVYEAEVIDGPLPDEVAEVDEPTVVLVNRCSCCNKASRTLGVLFGKPYCGGCILSGAKQGRELIGMAAGILFPGRKKKARK